MITGLEAERDRLIQRIQFFTRNCDSITDYIQAARPRLPHVTAKFHSHATFG